MDNGVKAYGVLAAAQQVAIRARFVQVDEAPIARWTDTINPVLIQPVSHPPELNFIGSTAEIALWVLLVDCLNFCFWTANAAPWTIDYFGRSWGRYSALLASLHRAIHDDRGWLNPRRWASATPAVVAKLFSGHGVIPMLDDRVQILNETGQVLLTRYDGEATNILESARFRAADVAAALADNFASFHDLHRYQGMDVPILKRAQIFAADLAVAWQRTGGPAIRELADLTAFADYRIPQVLRHMGILTLHADLEARIEACDPIPSGSEEEVELRACTIWAVERMCRTLRDRRAIELPAWMLDEYLWDRSHEPDVTMQHHRTVTWYY